MKPNAGASSETQRTFLVLHTSSLLLPGQEALGEQSWFENTSTRWTLKHRAHTPPKQYGVYDQ
eukprot:6685885-Pyramimonas_sp.AAC.1